MPNEDKNLDSQIDLDAIINNMSSVNSEDYWFTKVSKIDEHDGTKAGTPLNGSQS